MHLRYDGKFFVNERYDMHDCNIREKESLLYRRIYLAFDVVLSFSDVNHG